MKLVSIIIPTFNRCEYIIDAIESVFDQTYTDYEIIIVDDGSTDETQEKLKPFQNKIRYIYQENLGPAYARNRGIYESSGDYIAFLDSDDIWLPDKLELQTALLKTKREVGLVYSDAYRMYGSTGTIEKDTEFVRLRPYSGWIFEKLFLDNFIHTSTAIVRRECLDKIGIFDEKTNFVPAEDYDLWLRIATKYEFDYVDRPLVKYRDHFTNISGKNLHDEIPQVISVIEKIISWDPQHAEKLGVLKNERLSNLHYWAGRNFFFTNHLSKSRKHFFSVVQYSPYQIRPYIYILASLFGFLGVQSLKLVQRIKKNLLDRYGETNSLHDQETEYPRLL
jgi:glycosyltransferase involved in cell wall biosynthesis